jgi:hypothetical protein
MTEPAMTTISCPPGRVITEILFASFGKPTGFTSILAKICRWMDNAIHVFAIKI